MALPSPAITNPCDVLLRNDTLLSRLAYEIAKDLLPVSQILALYKITEEEFNERIVDNPVFMTFFAEARSVWGSSSNAQQRIAAKAGIQLEQWLVEADRLLHDPNSPMAPKVELAKYLGRIAGVEAVHAERRAEVAGDSRTTVVINLGHARQVIEKERTPVLEADFAEVLPNGVSTPIFTQPFAQTATGQSPAPVRQPTGQPDGENRSFAGRLASKPVTNPS